MSNSEYISLLEKSYYRVFDNIFVRLSQVPKERIIHGRLYYERKIFFYVHIDKEWHLVFTGVFEYSRKSYRLNHIKYELESDLSINRFPDCFYSIAPHLYIPVTNIEKFFHRVKLAFLEYRKRDFI